MRGVQYFPIEVCEGGFMAPGMTKSQVVHYLAQKTSLTNKNTHAFLEQVLNRTRPKRTEIGEKHSTESKNSRIYYSYDPKYCQMRGPWLGAHQMARVKLSMWSATKTEA